MSQTSEVLGYLLHSKSQLIYFTAYPVPYLRLNMGWEIVGFDMGNI